MVGTGVLVGVGVAVAVGVAVGVLVDSILGSPYTSETPPRCNRGCTMESSNRLVAVVISSRM